MTTAVLVQALQVYYKLTTWSTPSWLDSWGEHCTSITEVMG